MRSIAQRLSDETKPLLAKGPLPITFVITDLDVGGAERALAALVSGLDRRRWTPSVVCLDKEGALAEPLRRQGIEVVCLDVDRRRPWQAFTRTARVLRRLRPRLVQSFLFHANIAARIAALGSDIEWVVGGLRVAEHGRRSHLRLERFTQSLGAGWVCVSEGVRGHAIASGRLAPDRLVTIPNGVDVARFDETNPIPRSTLVPGLGPETTLVGFVGRIEHQKGVDTLLEAARGAWADRHDWALLIIGDGAKRTHFEAEVARDPRLTKRTHFLGRRSDVPEILATMDLLVLPSRWEGMPNVVLEAMAARRAVVGTSVEGTSELIEDESTGLLVPPDDPEALGRAIERLVRDRPMREAFGRAGRARVEDHYSPAAVIRAYEELWSALLGIRFGDDQL
ncbi:MAG: glycosyltransferase [Isosphaeraceae bacterium]|nr:glycosyltransferase [Isosphaeraceae bacterium]